MIWAVILILALVMLAAGFAVFWLDARDDVYRRTMDERAMRYGGDDE